MMSTYAQLLILYGNFLNDMFSWYLPKPKQEPWKSRRSQ
jgi:hypothetical protein